MFTLYTKHADTHTCFQTDAPKRLMNKGASVNNLPTQRTADDLAQVKKESQTPHDQNKSKIIELEQQIKKLQKELNKARKQQEQERQEHQILFQEVEADLKSEKKLVEVMKQLERDREETQLQTEVELNRTKQLVGVLEKKIQQKQAASQIVEDHEQLKDQPAKKRVSKMAPICQIHAEQQASKQPSDKRLLELLIENEQLKKTNEELQESNILTKDVERRDQSVVRSLRVARPMIRTYTNRNRSDHDMRRMSGQYSYVAQD